MVTRTLSTAISYTALRFGASMSLVFMSALLVLLVGAASDSEGTLLWPADAIVLVAILHDSRARMFAYLLGGFIASAGARSLTGDSASVCLGDGICDLCELLIAFFALNHAPKFDLSTLPTPRGLYRFILRVVVIAPALSAIPAGLFLHYDLGEPQFDAIRAWYMSHAFGMLTIGPLLLSLKSRAISGAAANNRAQQSGLTLLAVVIATAAIFGQNTVPLSFLLTPVLILAVFRLDFSGTALACLLASLVVIIVTLFGHGPMMMVQGHFVQAYAKLTIFFLGTNVLVALTAAAQLETRRALQKSLSAEEESHERLISLSKDVICRLDANGVRQYISPASLELYGFTPEELLGQTPFARIHPDDRAPIDTAFQRALSGERYITQRYRAIRRDNSLRWVDASIQPIFDPTSGVPIEILANLRDITERVEAEDALRESEARFRGAFETAAHGIAIVSTDGRWLRVNKALCGIVGYSEAEMLASDFQTITHPEDLDADLDQVRAVLAGEISTYQMEKRYIHKSGETVWILLSVSLVRAADGSPIHFVSQIVDINARKQAEARLRDSEERFRRLYTKTPVMMHSIDGDGRILTVSDQWLVSTGYTREDVLGRLSLEFLTSESCDLALMNGVPKVFIAGHLNEIPLQIVKKDGALMDVLLSSIVERDAEGKPVRALSVCVDVTAQRRAEQALRQAREDAERANQAKSVFLATMSHEIRTPLNAIIGFTDILLSGEMAPAQQRNLRHIKDAGTSLLAIVNDVLDLSKIEAGRFELDIAPFNLPNLAEATLGIARAQAETKGLSLQINIEPGLPVSVFGDALRLRQVLLNLLSNAIKFTDAGYVRLDVSRGDASPNHLKFIVSDTGGGIPVDRQHLLFQRFSQVDTANCNNNGGSGLGLAISKHIVEAMEGGQIGMQSEPGRGSQFWFTAAFAPADPELSLPIVRPQASLPDRPGRILVVDDTHLNQVVLEVMLTNAGHATVVARNGIEALAALRRSHFDLILMDMEMPVMDGITATREIRMSAEAFRDVPIIAITANVLPGEANACRAAGMNDYLAKPVDRERLLKTVTRWMRNAGDEIEPSDRENALAVFNPEALVNWTYHLGSERASAITRMFYDQIENAQALFRAGPPRHSVISRAAHDLYGTAGTLGFDDLSARCRALLECLKGSGDPTADADQLIAQLEISLDRASAALRHRHEDFEIAAETYSSQ